MRRHPVRALTATSALALMLAAGCSSGSAGSPGGAAGSSASSGGSSSRQAVSAAALVKEASASNGRLRSAHITTTSELGGKTTNFSGVIAYHPTRLDFRIDVGGQELRELLVGRTFYIKVPSSAAAGAKPWISVPIAEVAKLSGIDLDSLLNNANADQTVTLLTKSADLKLVGTEDVDGVSTRHLSGTVDIDKYFGQLDSQEQSKQTTLQAMVEQLGVKDSHIDLWVNADNIPVKVVQTYDSKLGPGSSTMLLTDLNAPVRIKAPPPSQVQRMGH